MHCRNTRCLEPSINEQTKKVEYFRGKFINLEARFHVSEVYDYNIDTISSNNINNNKKSNIV